MDEEELLKLSPSAQATYRMGLEFYNRQQYLEASDQWTQTIDMAPNFRPVRRYLALSYEKLGWKRKAARQWEYYLRSETDPKMREQVQKRLESLR